MRARIAIAIAAAAAGVAVSAGAASASVLPPVPVRFAAASATAVTLIMNDPDSGHGTPPVWATDTIVRTVTVTRGARVPGTGCGLAAPAGCWVYTATLHDTGRFVTIRGAGTPNQSCAGCAGKKIRHRETGQMHGTYTVTFDASSPSPSGLLVPWVHNDHHAAASPPFTSTSWGELFFPAGTSFGNLAGGAYSWTYRVPFPHQQWIDSSD